jgi:hypothetical protein
MTVRDHYMENQHTDLRRTLYPGTYPYFRQKTILGKTLNILTLS